VIAPKYFGSGTTTAGLVLSFALTFLSPASVSGHGYVSSPTVQSSELSCSSNTGKSSWQALLAMEAITQEVSSDPYRLSVISEGGAAGDGSFVVSESQAYGVLTSALALVSIGETESVYSDAKQKFLGYFNGWKKMCENGKDKPATSCQSTQYCNEGKWPCLPGWKQKGDLSEEVGTGSAPDGDEDAIAGMIIATLAVKSDSTKPDWYDEVRDWADRSSTAFLEYNTALSTTKSHRLLKLGSCWGGWEGEGNNPSYHAPGHFRLMRDFQTSHGVRSYELPDFGDNISLEEKWNMLIDTSYAFLKTTQCPNTGLVPNWALVREVDSQTVEKQGGSFSGSGTPQYEFGAEAGRTMWRIAFDSALYPGESESKAGSFLAPLHMAMVNNFNESPNNGWEYFDQDTLQACSPDPGYVNSVFGSWHWNQFISAPVYSTLVSEVTDTLFQGKSFNQQEMIDAACGLVSDTAGLGYYPLSWQVIGIMTLNGEVAEVGNLLRGTESTSSPSESGMPSQKPSGDPTRAPTKSAAPIGSTSPPSKNPTASSTSSPTKYPTSISGGCCSQNFKDCVPWCGTAKSECLSCDQDVVWINGPQSGCAPRYEACTQNINACCEGLSCVGDEFYRGCEYIAEATESPTKNPTEHPSERPTESPTPSPTSPPTLPISTVVCSDLIKNECKDESSKCIWNKGKKKINTCSVKKNKYEDDCSEYKKRKCKNYCEWDGEVCLHKCDTEDKDKCKDAVDKKERQICKFKKKNNPIYKTCLDKPTETPTQTPLRD